MEDVYGTSASVDTSFAELRHKSYSQDISIVTKSFLSGFNYHLTWCITNTKLELKENEFKLVTFYYIRIF